MKKLLLFCAAAIFSGIVHAQGILECKKQSVTNYLGEGKRSAIMVECDTLLPHLFFYTSGRGSLTAQERVIKGKKVYLIQMDMTEKKHGLDETIGVYTDGYDDFEFPVHFDKPNTCVTYRIFNPNVSTIPDGYLKYRIQGDNYFKSSNYDSARDSYNRAAGCSDTNKDEIEMKLQKVSTITQLYSLANDSAKAHKYIPAINLYKQILSDNLNPHDSIAQNRVSELTEKVKNLDIENFKLAEAYYADHRWSKAEERYLLVRENKGDNYLMANQRLIEIERIKQRKQVLPKVFSYNFDSDSPFGFGYGTFNQAKGGGYINIRTNEAAFDVARNSWVPEIEGITVPENETASKKDTLSNIKNIPSLTVAIGFTIRLFCPNAANKNHYFQAIGLNLPKYPSAHLMFTPFGYTMNFLYDKIKTEEVDGELKQKYKTKITHLWTPQIGLMVKWSRLALSLIYEPHIAIDKDKKDYTTKSKVMFGLGCAF